MSRSLEQALEQGTVTFADLQARGGMKAQQTWVAVGIGGRVIRGTEVFAYTASGAQRMVKELFSSAAGRQNDYQEWLRAGSKVRRKVGL